MPSFYIYVLSSPHHMEWNAIKIGCTEDPWGRLGTYLTGCCPGLTPSEDLGYMGGIWETTAEDREEMYDYEDEIHNEFLEHRRMRMVPGDSEWFVFPSSRSALEETAAFLSSRSWIRRRLTLAEIVRNNGGMKKILCRHYQKNRSILRSSDARDRALGEVQGELIRAMREFILSTEERAVRLIAPCGTGKTRMTCQGMAGLCDRVIVCCPSSQIQEQWRATLRLEGVAREIYLMNGDGAREETDEILSRDRYCLITTYASCHLLLDRIATAEIVVFDEAHHMAGMVAMTAEEEGRTRRLLMQCVELDLRRIFLTFTPRCYQEGGNDRRLFSMDEEAVFGRVLGQLHYRELVHRGILPDYRLWMLRDEHRRGSGLRGKAECLLKAWRAREIDRGEEKFILHHLIVFALTNEDAMRLERMLREGLATEEEEETLILNVRGGDNVERAMERFSTAPRAIIINCFCLGEGVDIPIANAVAFVYPKQSKEQITQMILRAGRWYPGKAVFHILIPIMEEETMEDMAAFEEVLLALASFDDQFHALLYKSMSISEQETDQEQIKHRRTETHPECIVIDSMDGFELDRIRQCFQNIRQRSWGVARWCHEKKIDTSVEYHRLRTQFAWPADPRDRARRETWYEFLHPREDDGSRISHSYWRKLMEGNGIRSATQYESWRQSDRIRGERLPSLQHLMDGYFGEETNFTTLLLPKEERTMRDSGHAPCERAGQNGRAPRRLLAPMPQ